jgi:hypothetical protein
MFMFLLQTEAAMSATPNLVAPAMPPLLTPPNSGGMVESAAKKMQEREALRQVIQQWNANRLDLFELTEPNEVSHTK